MSDNALLEAADLLEKAAAYIEELEAAKQKKEADEKKQITSKLAETIGNVVGEPVSNDLIEKLSNADPDIKNLIGRIANTDIIDTMGGPENEIKVANASGVMGSAEANLLNFLMT